MYLRRKCVQGYQTPRKKWRILCAARFKAKCWRPQMDRQTDRQRKVIAQLRLLHPSGREMRETFREWQRTALPNRCCHHRGRQLMFTVSGCFLFFLSFFFFLTGICILWTTECDKAWNTLEEIFSSSKHNFPISPQHLANWERGRGVLKKNNPKKQKLQSYFAIDTAYWFLCHDYVGEHFY